jgi:hypothetical protein
VNSAKDIATSRPKIITNIIREPIHDSGILIRNALNYAAKESITTLSKGGKRTANGGEKTDEL